ncbi:hypothetical protein F5884DRAFT_748575 [Xylogone sp. PMI_703]|nr:hypothetical protein F5884DRAFT_748575 [Xylogone sp. PMI_703]
MPSEDDEKLAAKKLIQGICEEHGFMTEEEERYFSPEALRIAQRKLLAKDKLIGSSVLTQVTPRDFCLFLPPEWLAKKLYTSNARFIFELLQNADDNTFNTARQRDEMPYCWFIPARAYHVHESRSPYRNYSITSCHALWECTDTYVSFKVFADRIEIDCNEDGFTPENIRAICNVGQSSKSGAQGYIGEKGIGFKSVFMYASRVHIQSGPFSFYFQHREGDSGTGMISPIWQDPEQNDFPRPLTRTTLFRREFEDTAKFKQIHQTLHEQLNKLQSTLLLFLRNIRCIKISIFNGENLRTSYTKFKSDSPIDRNRIQPDTMFQIPLDTISETTGNENRTYSKTELASNAFAKSEIILAFPVTKDSQPLIERQDLFAFFPVRKFIIQADFVTQANRQDIVVTSARNRGLQQGIADTFVKAVLQFCKNDTLQYTWMRYLPSKDYPWDPFWGEVSSGIKKALMEEDIVRSQKEGVLRRIVNLRYREKKALDQYGEPLFGDLDPGIYLSDKYNTSDVDILKEYGLPSPSMKEIILTVEKNYDFCHAKIFAPNIDNVWHTKAVKLLSEPFINQRSDEIDEINKLRIVPLCGFKVGPVYLKQYYYPDVSSVLIPRDLDKFPWLIKPEVANNESWKIFLDYIGVKTADIKLVRQSIFQKYQNEKLPVNLENSFDHLKFLYLTHEMRTNDESFAMIKIHN